jgi:thiol:disulfide interchange protein
MGSLVRRALVLLTLFVPSLAMAAGHEVREHYTADLVTESAAPAAGKAVTVALHIAPKAGWHIYWSNPGESGYAPTVAWTMPAGWQAGPLRHPVPSTLVAGGLVSYVHEGETVLLQDIAIPAGATGMVPVKADVDLLICNAGTCVPDPVTLDATITLGNGQPDPAQARLFAQARTALPAPLPGEASYLADAKGLSIFLPGLDAAQKATLFIDTPDAAKPVADTQARAAEGGIVLTVPSGVSTPTGALSGVVRVGDKGFAFTAGRTSALPAPASPSSGLAQGFDTGFLVAFATAVLGGLILNLMPCVFPILSLKALALARYGEGNAKARSEALGYSLGTIGTVVALGALLLLLRSGGAAVGWAFQLQNPTIVGVLLLLVTAIAVNLAGVFELPGLSVASSGNKSGFVGAMGTGALAAFIATPCTGPFMAGALGAALVMPPIPALSVMAGLGVGMALPFFLIGFVPALRRFMPRPGNWMVTLRHLLAVPMFATALGLAWIIGRQGGVSAMTMALAAALLLGMGLWWYGARQKAGRHGWPAFGVAMASLALALFGVMAEPAAAGNTAQADELHSVAFDTARLDQLVAARKPVFLYLTADWCLSCKVNEATSLSAPQVAEAFRKGGVTVMRGDWTRQDPKIAAFLKEHGRAGVPLYLWYPQGGTPQELPQVLTPGLLTDLVKA